MESKSSAFQWPGLLHAQLLALSTAGARASRRRTTGPSPDRRSCTPFTARLVVLVLAVVDVDIQVKASAAVGPERRLDGTTHDVSRLRLARDSSTKAPSKRVPC